MRKLLPERLNNHNLHLVAISNLRDPERQVQRWWTKKYKQPLKPFEEHCTEELLVEMLEDHYERHPDEAERYLSMVELSYDEDWDGEMPEEYEREIQKRLKKAPKVDLSKYQSDEELSEEEEKELLENLGRNLPKSKQAQSSSPIQVLGDDEFEEDF